MSRGKTEYTEHPLSDVNLLRAKVMRLKNASVFDLRPAMESVAESAMVVIENLLARIDRLEKSAQSG